MRAFHTVNALNVFSDLTIPVNDFVFFTGLLTEMRVIFTCEAWLHTLSIQGLLQPPWVLSSELASCHNGSKPVTEGLCALMQCLWLCPFLGLINIQWKVNLTESLHKLFTRPRENITSNSNSPGMEMHAYKGHKIITTCPMCNRGLLSHSISYWMSAEIQITIQ